MRILTFFMSLLCLVSTAYAEERPRSFYVIAIGNNQPPEQPQGLAPLRYADDDAVRFFELFGPKARRTLLATIDAPTRARYPQLTREALSPTYSELKRTVADYARELERDRAQGLSPTVFITFSGHGDRDAQGQAFLSLGDVPLTQTRLFEDILPLLSNANVHLFIDACGAGAVVGVRGGPVEIEGQTASTTTEEKAGFLRAHSLSRFLNVGALIASASDQQTHEWSRIESGVFSHQVLSALRGAADVNGDLQVAYSEVQAFLSAANRDVADPRARPSVLAHLPRGGTDATLLSLRDLTHNRILFGDAGKLGHFHVELANGERLLDAHFARGYRAALSVPAEQVCFVRRSQAEAEVRPGKTPVSLNTLTFSARQLAERGSVEQSLRDGLWKSPFGPTYYRGFVDSSDSPGVSFERPAPIDTESTPRDVRARKLVLATGILTIASMTAFGTSLWLTLDAKHDFDATNKERQARELRSQVQRRFYATVATGAVSALGAGATLYFWPRIEPTDQAGVEASLMAGGQF